MFFGLLSNCVALSDRSFPPELRSFEVTILGINSSRTRESWRKGKSASRQQPFIGRVLYTGRRSFHLRETRLAEPARRKERDKQVGARRGSEYLLPSGIPSLQRCLSLSLSVFPFRGSSFPLRVVFLCLLTRVRLQVLERAERASYGNLSLAV